MPPAGEMTERPVHIALNAQLLSLASSYRNAGISWYIYRLLRHLPDANDGFRLTAFTGERLWKPPEGLDVAWTRWPTQRPAARIAWEQLAQPCVLMSQRVDLIHSLAYVLPGAWFGPAVVTILDLSFVLFPERFRPLNRLYLNVFTRLSARRADKVIAISDNTKRDAVRLLGLNEKKVQVVYCGVDSSFRPAGQQEVSTYQRKRGLPERFILFLGTLEPRKNLGGLVDAYHLLKEQWKPSDGDLPDLVIAGARGWYYEEVYQKVQQLDLVSRVHFVGYVPMEELPFLYSAAELFVYPSLYEGFGLPVLQAMACGTAVVTSDRSSLPEVIGDAGVVVNPEDVHQLAAAIQQVLTDTDIREKFEAQGRQRAAGFSWENTAIETVAVYHQALRGEGQ